VGTATDRLSLTEFEFAGRPGIAVLGEVDEGTCGELELALRRISSGGGLVLLDLYDCTFLDSKGLDAIVRGAMRLWDEGGQLTVHNARGPIRQLFRITGLTGVEGLVLHRDLPG
jgi:anti-anti-sigma factor